MAKLILNDVTSGYASTIALNAAFTAIETAMENTVSRDGTAPNTMSSSLDMNSNRILNLPEPVQVHEAARLQDVQNGIAGASVANLITATATTNNAGTTVQAQLNNIGNSTGAASIGNVPAGTITATTVQAALNELDSETQASLATKQPLDATLTALAGLATGADKLAYSTGVDTFSETTLTSFVRTVLDDTDAVTIRTTTGTEPTLLAEYTVSGAAVTSIQFTGLDISAHKGYKIIVSLKNATASLSVVSLYVNGDITATNYYTQYVDFSGATVTAARANVSGLCSIPASSISSSRTNLTLVNGYSLSTVDESRNTGVGITLHTAVVSKSATVANITQLDFVASIANSLDIGSTIRIYRGDK